LPIDEKTAILYDGYMNRHNQLFPPTPHNRSSNPRPDRRRSPRHRLKNGALVIEPKILGTVLDISLHGMLFEYLGEDLKGDLPEQLGIFISGAGLLVTGLRVDTVRDQVLEYSSFLPIIRKTRAVAFLHPSDEQKRLLRQIIARHTVASRP